MAKKKDERTERAADDIIDSLAADVGADKPSGAEGTEGAAAKDPATSAPVVPPGGAGVVPVKLGKPGDAEGAKPSLSKASDKPAKGATKSERPAASSKPAAKAPASGLDLAHKTMTDLLMEGGGHVRESVSDEMKRHQDPELKRRGALNLVLIIIFAGLIGTGGYALSKVASEEARSERVQKRLELERKHMEEQMAKLKKFGNLRIESNPPGATVLQDGQKISRKDPVTNEEIVAVTPMDVQNLDIKQVANFSLVKDGYEQFNFSVAEHLWAKTPGSDDYAILRTVDLVPTTCEYWFLYDGSVKKEMKFPDQPACNTHHDAAVKKNAAVTECTCKIGMPPAVPSK